MKQLWNDLVVLAESGYAIALLAGFFLLVVAVTFWLTKDKEP